MWGRRHTHPCPTHVYPDAHPNQRAGFYPHRDSCPNKHPDGDSHAYSARRPAYCHHSSYGASYAYPNGDADAHTVPHTDAHVYTYANFNPRPHANADTHTHANPNTKTRICIDAQAQAHP